MLPSLYLFLDFGQSNPQASLGLVYNQTLVLAVCYLGSQRRILNSFQMLKKEEAIPWPGTLAIVHSYIAYKAGKVCLSKRK